MMIFFVWSGISVQILCKYYTMYYARIPVVDHKLSTSDTFFFPLVPVNAEFGTVMKLSDTDSEI